MLNKFIPFLILLFVSCSLNKPAISELYIKKLAVETSKGVLSERLSAFIKYHDKDGLKDFASITIIQKETGLKWHLDRENTAFFVDSENGKKDILKAGSNKLAYPLGKFPQGTYTITLEDLMGHKEVQSFILTETLNLQALPMEFTADEKNWQITAKGETAFTKYALILLGADKQPLYIKRLGSSSSSFITGSVSDLKEVVPDARYIQCFAENFEQTAGYLTIPLGFQLWMKT